MPGSFACLPVFSESKEKELRAAFLRCPFLVESWCVCFTVEREVRRSPMNQPISSESSILVDCIV